MKAIRIFLLILIIIGVGLLLTQNMWVPKLVNKIIESEAVPVQLVTKTSTTTSLEKKIPQRATKAHIKVKGKTIEVLDAQDTLLGRVEIDYSEVDAPNLSGILSPNEKFLYYSWGRGDGFNGYVYDISSDVSHYLGVVSKEKWLEDNKLEFWVGCVTPDCKHYRSTDGTSPWVVNEVKPLSISGTSSRK